MLAVEIFPARGDSGLIELPLREWELAQLLAITPQYLCTLMQELLEQGRMERRGRRWSFSGNLQDSAL